MRKHYPSLGPESHARTVTRLFRCRKSLTQILRYPKISTFCRLLLLCSCGSNMPHSDSVARGGESVGGGCGPLCVPFDIAIALRRGWRVVSDIFWEALN